MPTGTRNVVFVDKGEGKAGAAHRAARREVRRHLRGAKWPGGRRARRRERELPDRRRVESARRAEGFEADNAASPPANSHDRPRTPSADRFAAMPTRETFIERIIEASARNKFLVFIFTIFAIAAGILRPDAHAARCDSRSERRAGDRLHRLGRPLARPGRRSDHLSDFHRFIAAPKVKFVRGESMFGKSFVYVIFEDGTDIYWARSRVIEYLNSVRGSLPEGVNPVIGPDATGVGWVYEYALVDDTGKHDLAELRSLQDWHLRYALESVKGVAEVAPVGGFVKQYQVDLDPNKLVAYGIPLSEVVSAIKMSNGDVGGKIFEVASTEYYVRGRGYIKSIADIENIVLKVENGTPVYVKNVGNVHLGADLRRGVAELDGKGEVVGGIVVMRYGENALNVIDGIKKKMEEIKSSLPEGVRIVPTYDRSELIKRAIDTLREKLIEESIVVALVCLVFLWHVRSALVGDHHAADRHHPLVPADVVAGADLEHHVARRHRHRHRRDGGFGHHHGRERAQGARTFSRRTRARAEQRERVGVIIAAAKSVGRPLFFALLVITVSFIPVFSLARRKAGCSSRSRSQRPSRCSSPRCSA